MATRKKAPAAPTATDTLPADAPAAAAVVAAAAVPAPVPAPVAPTLCPDPVARLDAIGIDWLCEQICAGVPQTQMALALNVGVAALSRWMAADTERSARVREARMAAAHTFEEMAERVLREALDTFELARAKQLAEHYRWKAAKFSPREFGQQAPQRGDAADAPASPTALGAELTDEQLDAKLAELIAAAATAAEPGAAAATAEA